MKYLVKCAFLAAGTIALLTGDGIAYAEINKCVGAGGKVLYGDDCPSGTDEMKLKGTVSVGDKIKAKPSQKSGPTLNSMENSWEKEKLSPVQKRGNPNAPLKE